MQLDRRRSSRRRGIAGLIAAVIMFTLLFTVGLGFYMNLNAGNSLLQQAQNAKIANAQAAISENLLVTAIVNQSTNTLEFAVTNQGGVTVSIVAYFATGNNQSGQPTRNVVFSSTNDIVLSSTDSCPKGYSALVPTPCLSTGVPCEGATGQCSVTLVTSRGNDFPATYDLATGTSGSGTGGSSSQSGVSEGIGLFSFDFTSFDAYYCTGASSPCATQSPCTLSQSVLCSGYSVPRPMYQHPTETAFSFTIKNLDPCHRTLQINDSTSLTETNTNLTSYYNYYSRSSVPVSSEVWSLANKSGGQIVLDSTNFDLKYGQSTTVYFAFGVPYCLNTGGNNCGNSYYCQFFHNCNSNEAFSSDPYSVSLTLVGDSVQDTGLGTAGCPAGLPYGQVFPLFTTVWQQPNS